MAGGGRQAEEILLNRVFKKLTVNQSFGLVCQVWHSIIAITYVKVVFKMKFIVRLLCTV